MSAIGMTHVMMSLMVSERKKEPHYFNWDHDVNPTPLADLEANLAFHVGKRYGNPNDVCVRLSNDSFEVLTLKRTTFNNGGSFGAVCEPHWEMALKVNFNNGVPSDVTGRTSSYLPMSCWDLYSLVSECL